ncbi:helix-turn-helix domain-containing protein [Streptomyces celluloflavus]|uniref:helix-turn-helix domain-containing protein n=1 Tax=Streptomyces celluloflavus TaxID=58344 RepID=UPI0036AE3B33
MAPPPAAHRRRGRYGPGRAWSRCQPEREHPAPRVRARRHQRRPGRRPRPWQNRRAAPTAHHRADRTGPTAQQLYDSGTSVPEIARTSKAAPATLYRYLTPRVPKGNS